MGSPINTIIEQMKKALDAGTTLMAALPGGVHNRIPEKPSYPYIRIGDASEQKFNTFNHVGKTTFIRVHVFDITPTDFQVQTLAGLADDLLDNITLTLTSWTSVLISWENTDIITDEDGKTHHAIMTYRIISQKT